MGFVRARRTLASQVLSDLGVNLDALAEVANTAARTAENGSPLLFRSTYPGVTNLARLLDVMGEPLSVSMGFLLENVRRAALSAGRKVTSADLFLEFAGINHYGNRIHFVLRQVGFEVGWMGANQDRLRAAFAAYETQAQHDSALYVRLTEESLTISPYSAVAPVHMEVSTFSSARVAAVTLNRARCVLDYELAEFEALVHALEQGDASEHDLQVFLEAHPTLLPHDGIVQVMPHYELFLDDGGSLVPDFLLVGRTGATTIVELKKPTALVMVGKSHRVKPSESVHIGLAQLREYGNALKRPANIDRLEAKIGMRLHGPRLTLVIGRRPTGPSTAEWYRILSQDLRGEQTILTFDDLLETARDKRVLLTPLIANAGAEGR